MPDKEITCVDCGAAFVFTEREQEWYREKGLAHEPRRCKGCRSSRKSPGGGGGGGGHGGGPGGSASHAEDGAPHAAEGGGGHGPRRHPQRNREMFQAACATCGKPTEVPFRPDPSRPVYCRDCYVARGKKR